MVLIFVVVVVALIAFFVIEERSGLKKSNLCRNGYVMRWCEMERMICLWRVMFLLRLFIALLWGRGFEVGHFV